MINSTVTGMRLTHLRKERGQTRAYVARQLGVPYSTLVSYESGVRTPPDRMKIRLAEYFGMSVGDLFFADENHEK